MKTRKHWLLTYVLILIFLLVANGCGCGNDDESNEDEEAGAGMKIIAPPDGGMYIGQSEITEGARETLEQAIGRKAAIWARMDIMTGMEESDEHALNFNLQAAQDAWDNGYVVMVGAYEAHPGHGSFTVDKLLNGEYDEDLARVAEQFRQFGKPMFFSTAREPNGVLSQYMGGFGPDGDQGWEAGDLVGQFTPPETPSGNPDLYDGLGDDTVCDGIERLAAAQRYYYDFFVRREGVDFLTFETMGWVVPIWEGPEPETEVCLDWKVFYDLLEGYADWVSINFYLFGEQEQLVVTDYLDYFDDFMTDNVRKVAPDMPVLITELGFCGEQVPEKITQGLNHFLSNYPEINGFMLWGDYDMDCQIEPGQEGDAFKAVIEANPDMFKSCVSLSDGSTLPGCE